MGSLLLSLFAALAVGEPEPVRTPVVDLQWTAPAGCPTQASVRARIEALVGRPLGADPERTLRVVGAIRRAGGRHAIDLRLTQPDGHTDTRRFEAPTCEDLAEPAAVVVAIAVSGDAAPAATSQPPTIQRPTVTPPVVAEVQTAPPRLRPEPPPRPAAPSPKARAAPPDSTPVRRAPPASPAPRSLRQPRVALGVAGGFGSANLPAIGAALEGGLGVLFPRLRLDLRGVHEFSRRGGRGPAPGLFSLTAAGPEACLRLGARRLRFPVCGGFELGVLRAEGLDVTAPETVRRLWLAVTGGGGVAWSAGEHFALRLQAEVVAAPLRREFTVDGVPIFITRLMGARVVAGVEIRLP